MGYFWRCTVYSHSSQCSDSFEWFTVLSEDTFNFLFFNFKMNTVTVLKFPLLLLSSTSHYSKAQFISLNIAEEAWNLNSLNACLN